MGGHSAWRKRVANGELAKGSGGAILRHRPRLGRKGKDIELSRKGNILGGPNKKKKNRHRADQPDRCQFDSSENVPSSNYLEEDLVKYILLFISGLLTLSVTMLIYWWYAR